MKKLLIAGMLFFFLVQVFLLNVCYAVDQVDISELDERLADALGISDFAGGLIISTIFMAIFLFPSMLLAKGKDNQLMIILFVGLTTMSICIALTWLPYFLLLVVGLIIAFMFAGKFRDAIGGH